MVCCVLSHFSHVWLSVSPWTIVHPSPVSMGFSRPNTGMDCRFPFFSQVGNVCLTNKFILLVFTVIADITEIISTIFHCGFWLTHFCMLLASYFYFLWLFCLLFWPLLFYAIHNLHNRFQFFNWLLLQFCCGHKVLNQFPYSFLGTFKEFMIMSLLVIISSSNFAFLFKIDTWLSCYKDNFCLTVIIYVHVCMCSVLSCVRRFVTQWAAAYQASLPMEFFKKEYWNRLPFSTSGDLLNPGIKPASLVSPALAGRLFTTEPPTCLYNLFSVWIVTDQCE